MWEHFCHELGRVKELPEGQDCDLCGKDDTKDPHYQGLFWVYELREYLRWPQYMEFYYNMSQNKS